MASMGELSGGVFPRREDNSSTETSNNSSETEEEEGVENVRLVPNRRQPTSVNDRLLGPGLLDDTALDNYSELESLSTAAMQRATSGGGGVDAATIPTITATTTNTNIPAVASVPTADSIDNATDPREDKEDYQPTDDDAPIVDAGLYGSRVAPEFITPEGLRYIHQVGSDSQV